MKSSRSLATDRLHVRTCAVDRAPFQALALATFSPWLVPDRIFTSRTPEALGSTSLDHLHIARR